MSDLGTISVSIKYEEISLEARDTSRLLKFSKYFQGIEIFQILPNY